MTRKALPLLAFLLTAFVGVQAQHPRKVAVRASVPFEFFVGNRVFPAGMYMFEMATGTPHTADQAGVLVVRGGERKTFAAVATDVSVAAAARTTPKLVFVRRGEHVYLSEVWREGNDAGLRLHVPQHNAEAAVTHENEPVVLSVLSSSGRF